MALFKISKGLKANLPSAKKEGYCYVTTDDGKFYIDTSDTSRIALNAEKADSATLLSADDSKLRIGKNGTAILSASTGGVTSWATERDHNNHQMYEYYYDANGTYEGGHIGLNSSNYGSYALPRHGGTMSGNIEFLNSGTDFRCVWGICGDNDYWRVGGGATGSNAGFLEIATADDGTEPIYVR